jgi:CelD/BcsL family acetyltransferase involved in cellulose biosynthesis
MVWSPPPAAQRESEPRAVPPAAGGEDRISGLRFHQPRRVTVELATTPQQLLALKPEYDHLNAICGNTLPFALHDWHVAWWTHLAKTERHLRDELRIHVVRDDRGECVAIVPLVSTRREIGAFHTESLGLLGSDPNFTEIRGPLVAPGAEELAARAVTRRLRNDGGWDWLYWSGLQGPFAGALVGAATLGWRPPVLDYVVDLAPTWDAFRADLKRNIRESLRHCYNSLKRDGLSFELEVAQTPDAVRNALHMFVSLHAMRAGLTRTVAHPDRFASMTARSFLYDVCERLAARGVTRIFMLKIRGCVVAVRIGFVVGDQIYLYYSGFDPRWAKYSVSTTIVAETIKYAIDQGLRAANLSTGTDVSKTRWGARLVTFAEATQTPTRLRSRVKYAAYLRLKSAPLIDETDWFGALRRAMPVRTLL